MRLFFCCLGRKNDILKVRRNFMITSIIYLILLFSLLVAGYTDLKSRTIPLWLFPSTAVISCGMLIYFKQFGYWNLIGFVCMLIPTFALAVTGNFGGGDVLMFAAIGIILGENIVLYVFIMTIVSTTFFLITRLKNKEYPIAPFALISYIIFLFWRYLLC